MLMGIGATDIGVKIPWYVWTNPLGIAYYSAKAYDEAAASAQDKYYPPPPAPTAAKAPCDVTDPDCQKLLSQPYAPELDVMGAQLAQKENQNALVDFFSKVSAGLDQNTGDGTNDTCGFFKTLDSEGVCSLNWTLIGVLGIAGVITVLSLTRR